MLKAARWSWFFGPIILLASSHAQQESQDPAASLKVTTRLVQVDVVVTGSKDDLVTGLTRDEFTILEDGKPQKLASFVAHHLPVAPSDSDAARNLPSLPPGVFTNRSVSKTEGALTILLLDALNTALVDQTYSRARMLKYLQAQHEWAPKTAILALTNNLFVLQDFTSDGKALRSALEKRLPSGSTLLDDPDLDRLQIPNAPPEVIQRLERFERDLTAQRTEMRMQITLAAMQLIARVYGGIPGRKNLIWVSAAFPLMLTPDKIKGLTSRSQGEELRRTAAMLERARVAVYPVDARGLMGTVNVTFTGRDRAGHLMTAPELAAEMSERADAISGSHGTMQEIAEQTGGRAYRNRNDIDQAVALAIADGNAYYTLAYYPENKNWNGKYRKIEVKASPPDLHLRYRRGYVASDLTRASEPPEQAKREIETALFDPMLQTLIGLDGGARIRTSEKLAPAGTPPKQEVSAAKVAQKARISFRVDARGISFEDAEGGLHTCSVELVTAAFDERSNIVAQTSRTLNGKLKSETYSKLMQEGLVYNVDLDVPSHLSRFRLLVRDNRTGLMGTLDVPYSAAQ